MCVCVCALFFPAVRSCVAVLSFTDSVIIEQLTFVLKRSLMQTADFSRSRGFLLVCCFFVPHYGLNLVCTLAET